MAAPRSLAPARNFVAGGHGRGYGGYGRGYGGYGRGYGGYGGYGPGGLAPFGLGLLLGSGLGAFGLGGLGYGGLGYGGYGAGGYPSVGYGYTSLGSGYYGPSNWLYGGSLYDYGYSQYSNPYYSAGTNSSPAAAEVAYDYSQPINVVSARPAEAVVDDATTLFNSARDACKRGAFAEALRQAQAALAKNPSDAALHELCALCLFAFGRYDEAATALYAVLSVGPGWDWPTLIGLYPDVNVYTPQLRRLEEYVKANPQSASARFVQAYHYLTEGYPEAAANALRQVVALKPDDTLSAKLLEQLEAAKQKPAGALAEASPVPAPAAVNTTVPEGATISGTWTGEPNADTKISLTIQPTGAFQWQVNQKGQTREFSGTSGFGGGILTLVSDKSPPIVGRLSWTDPDHMTFRVVGDAPDSPGLSFAKSASR